MATSHDHDFRYHTDRNTICSPDLQNKLCKTFKEYCDIDDKLLTASDQVILLFHVFFLHYLELTFVKVGTADDYAKELKTKGKQFENKTYKKNDPVDYGLTNNWNSKKNVYGLIYYNLLYRKYFGISAYVIGNTMIVNLLSEDCETKAYTYDITNITNIEEMDKKSLNYGKLECAIPEYVKLIEKLGIKCFKVKQDCDKTPPPPQFRELHREKRTGTPLQVLSRTDVLSPPVFQPAQIPSGVQHNPVSPGEFQATSQLETRNPIRFPNEFPDMYLGP